MAGRDQDRQPGIAQGLHDEACGFARHVIVLEKIAMMRVLPRVYLRVALATVAIGLGSALLPVIRTLTMNVHDGLRSSE